MCATLSTTVFRATILSHVFAPSVCGRSSLLLQAGLPSESSEVFTDGQAVTTVMVDGEFLHVLSWSYNNIAGALMAVVPSRS